METHSPRRAACEGVTARSAFSLHLDPNFNLKCLFGEIGAIAKIRRPITGPEAIFGDRPKSKIRIKLKKLGGNFKTCKNYAAIRVSL